MRHGFWCHWKWVIWRFACFWGPKQSVKCCRGGMHAPKYFILGIRLLWTLKDTFAKLWVLRTPAAPWNTIVPKKKVYFLRQLWAKSEIKGIHFMKLRVQKFRKKSWFLYVFSGTELFLNTKPLQKKPVPLKLGQLWLCQTF